MVGIHSLDYSKPFWVIKQASSKMENILGILI